MQQTQQHRDICSCMSCAHTWRQELTGPEASEGVHTTGARGRVETAGDFFSSCISPLSPQVALPGRYSAGKAASGPCGHRKPEFTIDFCLSRGIRTGSSESQPARSVGGPARRKPRAPQEGETEAVAPDKGLLRGTDVPPARILPCLDVGLGRRGAQPARGGLWI